MGPRVCISYVSCLLILHLAGTLLQAQSLTGNIAGTVKGPGGYLLPGVEITARAVTSSESERLVTNDQGGYLFLGLKAGKYLIRAESNGFGSIEIPDVNLLSHETEVVDIQMSLAVIEQVVDVIGEAPQDSVEFSRIRESPARDVGEALTAMTGVWKVRRGGIANEVVLRGYQGENLTVLIDGMRLYGACPNNMDHTSFHVDFAEVDRVEVGKGPFDMKNQGSLGGTVNIVTKRPGEGFHVMPNLSWGSFGYVNPSLTGSYGNSHVGILGGFSYRMSDPYRDGSGQRITQVANYQPSNFGTRSFDIGTGWLRADLNPSSRQWLRLAYTRQDAGQIIYPYLQMDAVYDDANRFNLEYEISNPGGSFQFLRLQGYYSGVQHWMTDHLRVSSMNMARGYSMGTMAKTGTGGGRIQTQVRNVTIGLEYFQRRWDASTQMAMAGYLPQASIPDVHTNSVGAYFEYSKQLSASVRLDLGGRLDQTTSQADPHKSNTSLYYAYQGTRSTSAQDLYPSGKFRLSYQLTEGLNFYGGVGHTVRVPDPQERFFALRRMGTDWVGNPNLLPTAATGFDVGASYRRSRFSWRADLYWDSLADYIMVYAQPRLNSLPGMPNPVAKSYCNVDARMSGLEIEMAYWLTSRLSLNADLSAVRGRESLVPALGINSPYLPEIPPLRSRAALRYDRQAEGWRWFAELEGVASAAQRSVDSDLSEIPTPGYGIVNLKLGTTLRKFQISGGLGNAFDKYYVESLSYQRDAFRSGVRVPEPGRNIYLIVSYAF